jgi:hypothetical protein
MWFLSSRWGSRRCPGPPQAIAITRSRIGPPGPTLATISTCEILGHHTYGILSARQAAKANTCGLSSACISLRSPPGGNHSNRHSCHGVTIEISTTKPLVHKRGPSLPVLFNSHLANPTQASWTGQDQNAMSALPGYFIHTFYSSDMIPKFTTATQRLVRKVPSKLFVDQTTPLVLRPRPCSS